MKETAINFLKTSFELTWRLTSQSPLEGTILSTHN